MSSSHFIADLDFSLSRDIYSDQFVYARGKFIAVLSGENLDVYDDTGFSVRNLQGGVSDLSGLFTEDSSQESLFSSQLCFTLRGYLSYQDISGIDFGTDSDDTFLIQILESILTHVRNVSGNLFRSQFGVSGF